MTGVAARLARRPKIAMGGGPVVTVRLAESALEEFLLRCDIHLKGHPEQNCHEQREPTTLSSTPRAPQDPGLEIHQCFLVVPPTLEGLKV